MIVLAAVVCFAALLAYANLYAWPLAEQCQTLLAEAKRERDADR